MPRVGPRLAQPLQARRPFERRAGAFRTLRHTHKRWASAFWTARDTHLPVALQPSLVHPSKVAGPQRLLQHDAPRIRNLIFGKLRVARCRGGGGGGARERGGGWWAGGGLVGVSGWGGGWWVGVVVGAGAGGAGVRGGAKRCLFSNRQVRFMGPAFECGLRGAGGPARGQQAEYGRRRRGARQRGRAASTGRCPAHARPPRPCPARQLTPAAHAHRQAARRRQQRQQAGSHASLVSKRHREHFQQLWICGGEAGSGADTDGKSRQAPLPLPLPPLETARQPRGCAACRAATSDLCHVNTVPPPRAAPAVSPIPCRTLCRAHRPPPACPGLPTEGRRVHHPYRTLPRTCCRPAPPRPAPPPPPPPPPRPAPPRPAPARAHRLSRYLAFSNW